MNTKCLGCHIGCEGFLFCSMTCCFLAGYGNVREGVDMKKMEELKNDLEKQNEFLKNYPVRVRSRHLCECHNTKEQIEEEGRGYL